MEIIKTDIEGLCILEPRVFNDSRGYFFESYNKSVFDALLGPVEFVQDNESKSVYGVVRGLHFQKPPYSQAKLVRCVQGEVLDVAVDIRKDSPTYGEYVSVLLSGDNHRQFYIPKGFAHGFSVLSDTAVFQYKCDTFYEPSSEGGIDLFDKDLNIDWGVAKDKMILSDKDRRHPSFAAFETPFD
ncbi:MAG: dTDP-4-dehydrorhamnose 3,5-epimerase [Bacteroidales bacterium]|nr:dTDP-4-dehydrorhamnose 3,5-epimerase [Candidatus Cryptobacteroides equifaecalis]